MPEQLQMSSVLTHQAKNGYHVGFPTSPSQTEGDRKPSILLSADPPGACTPHKGPQTRPRAPSHTNVCCSWRGVLPRV